MKLKHFAFSVALSALFVMPQTGFTAGVTSLPQSLRVLYTQNDQKPFWADNIHLKRNARQIPDILNAARKHGINPERYGAENLAAMLALGVLESDDKFALDYALSFALWSYASDLAGRHLSDTEFAELAASRNLPDAVDKFAPDTSLYKALMARLAEIDKMSAVEKAKFEVQPIRFSGRLFKVGEAHPDVPILRARLMKYGAEQSFGDDPYTYDDILAQAVKNYQATHGLKPDGIIGPNTLQYLNRTLMDEREQIVTNLDRLRQPNFRARPLTRVDVDIARYWMKVYEDGNMVMEMPVVVGSTKRQTNVFKTTMVGVRINPGWTLPTTIKMEDYIPKLRENPEWVAEQGVKIYTDWSEDAEPVDPTLVDWSMLTDNQIKAMRMFKPAGSSNPLGSYRFLMPNRHDIYLHDTNQKDLFNVTMRARSSGCVRIEKPKELAEFLLKNDSGWTPEKIDEVLQRGETFDIRARREVPVYFDYKTAWLDENGKLILGFDVYDFDNGAYRDIVKKDIATQKEVASFLDKISLAATSDASMPYPKDYIPVSLF